MKKKVYVIITDDYYDTFSAVYSTKRQAELHSYYVWWDVREVYMDEKNHKEIDKMRYHICIGYDSKKSELKIDNCNRWYREENRLFCDIYSERIDIRMFLEFGSDEKAKLFSEKVLSFVKDNCNDLKIKDAMLKVKDFILSEWLDVSYKEDA